MSSHSSRQELYVGERPAARMTSSSSRLGLYADQGPTSRIAASSSRHELYVDGGSSSRIAARSSREELYVTTPRGSRHGIDRPIPGAIARRNRQDDFTGAAPQRVTISRTIETVNHHYEY